MKNKIVLFIMLVLSLLSGKGASQTMQWPASQPIEKNMLTLHAGVESGLVAGIGYGRVLITKLPILLTAGFSIPSGKNLTDDFKTTVGGQVQILHFGDFQLTPNLQVICKRYESSYVRLVNIGFDASTAFGYYRPKWFAAGEIGFDKALSTNFRHAAVFREYYPEVRDGWYGPATSGHLYYGLQTGFSIKRQDVYLRFGRVLEQDLVTPPFIPFYLELGTSRRF